MNEHDDERVDEESLPREPYERPAIEESARFETLALGCVQQDPELCFPAMS
jgi:hypothetical protein